MEIIGSEVGWSGEKEDSEVRRRKGEIFIEMEVTEMWEEEEPEEVETWGVYLQGDEKTLLGLFWDEELAAVFRDAVSKSKVLEKVREIS